MMKRVDDKWDKDILGIIFPIASSKKPKEFQRIFKYFQLNGKLVVFDLFTAFEKILQIFFSNRNNQVWKKSTEMADERVGGMLRLLAIFLF